MTCCHGWRGLHSGELGSGLLTSYVAGPAQIRKDFPRVGLWKSVGSAQCVLTPAREGWSTGPGCVEVRQLMEHPEFTLKNPNRLRSVVSVFIGSPQFHLADGSGYDFALEMIPKAGRAVGALRVSSCPRKVARVKRRALCSGGRPEPPGGGGHGQLRLPDLAKVGPRPAGADPREAEGPAEDEPRTREKIQAWYLWAGFKGKPKCNLFFSLGGGAP